MSLQQNLEIGGREYEILHPVPEHDHDAPPYQTQLVATGTDYVLTCSPHSGDEGLRCRFSIGESEWGYVISSRSQAQYEAMLPGFAIEPHKQLIEVGAGLSQPAVRWAVLAAGPLTTGPKPIVIDPADYRLMAEMVQAAIEVAPDEPHIRRVLDQLKSMRFRCQILLDPDYVRLLPVDLLQAASLYPELRGSADVVVDCLAAGTYVPVDFVKPNVGAQRRRMRETLFDVERSFLKEGGKHFTHVPAHHS